LWNAVAHPTLLSPAVPPRKSNSVEKASLVWSSNWNRCAFDPARIAETIQRVRRTITVGFRQTRGGLPRKNGEAYVALPRLPH